MAFVIKHDANLLDALKSLLVDGACSDVVFEVEGVSFALHRVILSAQSSVFKAMLLNEGRFLESSQLGKERIVLPGKKIEPWKYLVHYLYSGCLNIAEISLIDQLYLLDLAHEYDIRNLFTTLCDCFATHMLTVTNALPVFERACFYYDENPVLYEKFLRFINANADEIIRDGNFSKLPFTLVAFLISQDEFAVSNEAIVLKAIKSWSEANASDNANVLKLLENVRFSSKLALDDELTAWLKNLKFNPSDNAAPRIFSPPYNIATFEFGAEVAQDTKCNNGDSILQKPSHGGYANHQLDDPTACVVIKLPRPVLVTSMRLTLGAKALKYSICVHCGYDCEACNCSYCYKVWTIPSSSDDPDNWQELVDCSEKLCRNAQLIVFTPRQISSIKIQGFSNAKRREFSGLHGGAFFLTRFECPAVDDNGDALLFLNDRFEESEVLLLELDKLPTC